MRLLLIQVRVADDRMAAHERECIARKVEQPVEWVIRNAVLESASSQWLQDIDAVMIGGSGDFSVYDPRGRIWVEPLLELTTTIIARQIPIFGICFGHQVIGTCLGESVQPVPATAEIGTCDYHLTAEGKRDPLFSRLSDTFQAQAGHSDSVLMPPKDAEVMVSNATLLTQAFRLLNHPCGYSVQFHPDMTAIEARERYLAYRLGFESASPEAAGAGAEQFILQTDEATALLSGFVALAMQSSIANAT